MKKLIEMCNNCGGLGYTTNEIIPLGDGYTCKIYRKECPVCSGTGKKEFALFTIEEAGIILERCGLKRNECQG